MTMARNAPDYMSEGVKIVENMVEAIVLAANLTMTAIHPQVLRLDPGGAARTVTLPAEATHDGMLQVIENTADASEVITVEDDGSSTIATLQPGDVVFFYCNGTTWFATRLAATGSGQVFQTDVTIATAAVLTLNATPVALVPAPGANKAIVLVGVLLWIDFNSAAYDGIAAGEDLLVSYTNGAGQEVARQEATGFMDAVADEIRWLPAQEAALAAVSDITPVPNAALVLSMLVGEIATGDSPLKARVLYRVIDTVW